MAGHVVADECGTRIVGLPVADMPAGLPHGRHRPVDDRILGVFAQPPHKEYIPEMRRLTLTQK
jgi:hypothetical protein